VAREPFKLETVTLPVTISMGVAELDAARANGTELIARADENLYAAKRAGRNCVIG
jgi:GGDEF domain-containing protein